MYQILEIENFTHFFKLTVKQQKQNDNENKFES